MSDLLLSLQITVLSMGLVFGVILLIWLMMVLLTHFTADKKTSTEFSEGSESPKRMISNPTMSSGVSQEDNKYKAAALAVAIALETQEHSTAHPLLEPPTAIVSAWQLGMRTSQRSEKGNFRKH
jgi:Na+-transporting methylmalonyl-CoA/oxaloacetate decarboxylase gamma subunit